jgi:hypothetical protein
MASGQFASLDVRIPQGRVGWIGWRRRDKYSRTYGGEPEGRLTLSLGEDYDESEAQWIADVTASILDLLHMPSGMKFGIVRLDQAILDQQFVDADVVAEALEEGDERWIDVGQSFWPTDEAIRAALAALPAVLATLDHDRGLPTALMYYRLSTSDFAFLGDSITWALSDEGAAVPPSALDRQRVETALLNAWKAIEALIGGEPGKGSRFRNRLIEVGIDPDEQVGFRGRPREALVDVLSRMYETRDARAAHGGPTSARKRGITYYELMEAQHATKACLIRAVVHLAPEMATARDNGEPSSQ